MMYQKIRAMKKPNTKKKVVIVHKQFPFTFTIANPEGQVKHFKGYVMHVVNKGKDMFTIRAKEVD